MLKIHLGHHLGQADTSYGLSCQVCSHTHEPWQHGWAHCSLRAFSSWLNWKIHVVGDFFHLQDQRSNFGLFQRCITCNRSLKKSWEKDNSGHTGPPGMGVPFRLPQYPTCPMAGAVRAARSSLARAGQKNDLADAMLYDAELLHALLISCIHWCLLRRKIITVGGMQVNLKKPNFLLGYPRLDIPESLVTSIQKSKCNVISELQSALHKTTGKCRCRDCAVCSAWCGAITERHYPSSICKGPLFSLLLHHLLVLLPLNVY